MRSHISGIRWPFGLPVVCVGLIGPGTAFSQGSFALQHSLFNPVTNVQSGARQGQSVALDGNLAIAGAPSDAANEFGYGAVKIYNATSGALLHTLSNPGRSDFSSFGWSVAISGTRVVVGDPNESTKGEDVGIAYVYELAGATPLIPILTLSSPNPTKEGNFGRAVGISGSKVAVGAYGDSTGSGQAGRVYVFDLSSLTPAVPVAVLTNPIVEVDPFLLSTGFGSTLAISGSRLIVGAPYERSVNLGSAYVYDLSTIPPAAPLALSHPDRGDRIRFGHAVAISGSRVLVGAILSVEEVDGRNNIGVAYVFDLAGGNPTLATFTFGTPDRSDESFGSAVALSGNRMVIGADQIGISYVYDLSGNTADVPRWTLRNPQSTSENDFGSAVAIAGNKVLVGAPGDDIAAPDAGSAYLYQTDSPHPETPSATLASPSISGDSYFGGVVAVSGTYAVVGARNQGLGSLFVYDLARATPTSAVLELKSPRPTGSGGYGVALAMSGTRLAVGDPLGDISAGIYESVYLYDLSGVAPGEPTLTLQNPDPEPSALFGAAMAMSGTRIVVGAIWQDAGAVDAGRAYVFDLARATPTVPIARLNNPRPGLQDYFGDALAIFGSRVIVGSSRDDDGAMDSGVAYVFDLERELPGEPWLTLTNPAPAIFNYFGKQVAINGSWAAVAAPNAGRVYVYDLAGAEPARPIITLTEPDPVTAVSFGTALSLSANRLVVGAPWHEDGAIGAGIVYVFDLKRPTPSIPIASLLNPTPWRYDWFGSAVAVDGTTIVAGAWGDNKDARDRGAAYIFGQGAVLSMRNAAAGFATLTWTTVGTSDFVLQYADSPGATQWMDAPTAGQKPVTVALTNAARFYRLILR